MPQIDIVAELDAWLTDERDPLSRLGRGIVQRARDEIVGLRAQYVHVLDAYHAALKEKTRVPSNADT